VYIHKQGQTARRKGETKMNTNKMTKKQAEELEFHIESVEFYKEQAESFRKDGNHKLADAYINDSAMRHQLEVNRILATLTK
jgi:hypothetical protein